LGFEKRRSISDWAVKPFWGFEESLGILIHKRCLNKGHARGPKNQNTVRGMFSPYKKLPGCWDLCIILNIYQSHRSTLHATTSTLRIAVDEDEDGVICYLYSKAHLQLTEHLQNYNNGFSLLPAILFWLRKSRDLG